LSKTAFFSTFSKGQGLLNFDKKYPLFKKKTGQPIILNPPWFSLIITFKIAKTACPEAEFLSEIQTKILTVFFLAIHSHLYSFALRFLFLQIHATSYSFYSSVTVHCTGERRKT
jgi:hypothetical protein